MLCTHCLWQVWCCGIADESHTLNKGQQLKDKVKMQETCMHPILALLTQEIIQISSHAHTHTHSKVCPLCSDVKVARYLRSCSAYQISVSPLRRCNTKR